MVAALLGAPPVTIGADGKSEHLLPLHGWTVTVLELPPWPPVPIAGPVLPDGDGVEKLQATTVAAPHASADARAR
jgi:hypothetical protein